MSRCLGSAAGGWVPAGLVVGALAGLWLATGVTPGEIVLFGAYEIVLVLLPGWLLLRAIIPGRPGPLTQVVLGCTLGYLIEVASFVVTAAAGARNWLPICQAAVGAACALAWIMQARSRSGHRAAVAVARPTTRPPRMGWAIAGISILVLASLGIEYFAPNPLPSQSRSVSYPVDFVWALSIAGEALHHWPVSDPNVAGAPLYYHLFATFDTAAISQVTGISLPVVLFRLAPVLPALLAVCAIALAGRWLFDHPWVGAVAAALLVVVGELNIDLHGGAQFGNEFADDVIWQSPSFLFGLVFFVPALVLVCRGIGESRRDQGGTRERLLLALLLIGCAAAKASALPVLVLGLALFITVARVRGMPLRQLKRAIALACGVLAIYGAFWIFQYRDAGSYGLTFHLPGAVRQMNAVNALVPGTAAPFFARALLWLGLTVVGLFGAYGPVLAGLVGFRRRRLTGELDQVGLILLAVLMGGVLPYLAFTAFGVSQVYFVEYGLVGALLLSAAGICALWERAEGRSLSLLLVSAAMALLAGAAVAVDAAHDRSSLLVDSALALACGFLVAMPLARLAASRKTTLALTLVLTLVGAGAVARAVAVAGPPVLRLRAGQPQYSDFGHGLTPGLLRALLWIRMHTPTNAVLAVDNTKLDTFYNGRPISTPAYFYYSAFSERRVFLEGSLYSQRAFDIGETDVFFNRKVPFPDRRRLNEQVFRFGNARALCVLERTYRVRYLLVDRIHGESTPSIARLGTRVFGDRGATVYRTDGRCSSERSATAGRSARGSSRSTTNRGRPLTWSKIRPT